MDDERKEQSEVEQPPTSMPPTPAATAQPESEAGQLPQTSGMAIASLVLGLLGLATCVTVIPGLILGIIALVQISKNPTKMKGQGIALAGTIISAIGILVIPVFAAILFPVFARAKGSAQKALCMNNLKQISTAVQMYASDWDYAYPMAANWNEAIKPYAKNPKIMVCPSEKSTLPGYAMNAQMDCKKVADVVLPADTVFIFESLPGINQADGPELFPSPARHNGMHNVGFADGHAQSVSEAEARGLNFNPAATFVAPAPAMPEPLPVPGAG